MVVAFEMNIYLSEQRS